MCLMWLRKKPKARLAKLTSKLAEWRTFRKEGMDLSIIRGLVSQDKAPDFYCEVKDMRWGRLNRVRKFAVEFIFMDILVKSEMCWKPVGWLSDFLSNMKRFSSVSQSCPTFCNPVDCSMPGFPAHHQLPGLTQTHVHLVGDASNHPILSCPLLLLPSVLSRIRVFSNGSVLHIRWPKDQSFSYSKSPSNEYSGLISFRMDWFDPLTIQGTLKSLLQHHSSKASILKCSAFFKVQLSHPYMTTGKIIALTRWITCLTV